MSQATPKIPGDDGPTDCTNCGRRIRRFGRTRRWCHDETGNVQCSTSPGGPAVSDIWEIIAADVRRRPEQVGATTYVLAGVRDYKWGTFRTSDDLDEIREFQAHLPEWAQGMETRILRTTITCEQEWES